MPPKPINDQFRDAPVSRQRKYQLRMKARKRCVICGRRAVTNTYCAKHHAADRRQARDRYAALRQERLRNDAEAQRRVEAVKRNGGRIAA